MREMYLSPRGFKQGMPISGSVGGNAQVYESSAAEAPYLWLKVQQPTDYRRPEGPQVEATVHLSLEDAEELRDQLTYLIENHYQKGS